MDSFASTTTAVRPRATGRSTVRIVRTLDGLRDLRPAWEAIRTPWGSPMQSHDWVRTCAEVFGVGRGLEVVVAGEPPGSAIAHLVRSSRDGERLEFIGAHELPEPMDFLYADPADVVSLARTLARSRVPLRFPRLVEESGFTAALRAACRRRGILVCRPARGSPWIPLDASWSEPERHLNRGRRSNLRRARRIAGSIGALTVDVLSPTPQEVGPLLEEALAVEAAGWKGRGGSSLLQNAREAEFYRRYATAAAGRGVLRLCFVRIDGRAAAVQLAVEDRTRFWLLKIGHAEEFARASPGTLLLSETIAYAARSSLRSFEFLGQEEPWIRPWTSRVRPCVSLWYYPVGLRGGIAMARDAGRSIRARAGTRVWRGH